MNKQDEQYFIELSRDRAENANTLEKPSMRGIQKSVVDKYSDQAHFIYELLQNADDAKATSARFVVEPNRLIFAHNGARHFSISNPANEDQDSQAGKLGDLNAITSIANSNKTEASIGKFGVGFKAVFQYTSTPHVYDPEFRFKIERFIVPVMLADDFPERGQEETLFVFPFDHKEKTASDAYDDICAKLKSLSYPLLFMTQLKDIRFEFQDGLGEYGKEIRETQRFDDTLAENICLTRKDDGNDDNKELWLFTRQDKSQHKYSVGFFLDDKNHLIPISEPAFCFFPTKETTGLNFIIHAPFLLTDSREGVRAGVEHNDAMLHLLADLAADAMMYLRKIGEKNDIRLIDDNIVNIIPYDPDKFSDPSDKRKVSFLPFYETIQQKFANYEILPATDGYVWKNDAYWASTVELPQLFSNQQLGMVVENKNAKWIFTSMSRDEVQKNNNPLWKYIDNLVRTNINEDAIINGRNKGSYYNRFLHTFQSLTPVKGISGQFIETQNFEWLHKFYKWISKTTTRIEMAKTAPIFINQDKKAVPAYDKDNHLILFLPAEDITGYSVVNSEIMKNEDTAEFIENQIKITQPSLKDYIYNKILPMYHPKSMAINVADANRHFRLCFEYFCKCPNDEVDGFINLVKNCEFLPYYDEEDGQLHTGCARSLYFPIAELKDFLETKKGTRFLELSEFVKLSNDKDHGKEIDFLCDLGVKFGISTIESNPTDRDRNDLPHPKSTGEPKWKWKEINIDGCKEIIEYITNNKDIEKSIILWNCLLKVIETKCTSPDCPNLDSLLKGRCEYYYRIGKIEPFISSDAIRLKENPWIVNTDGQFVSAKDVTKDTLSNRYTVNSNSAQELLDFLGIVDDDNDANLTDKQKEDIEFRKQARALGIDSIEKLKELVQLKQQLQEKDSSGGRTIVDNDKPKQNTGNDILTDNYEDEEFETFFTNSDDNNHANEESTPAKPRDNLSKTARHIVQDIVKQVQSTSSSMLTQDERTDIDIDQDDYTPSAINYKLRFEKTAQKSAAEINRIAYIEELQEKAINAPRYSYGWFKTLLEMECAANGEANKYSKEVSISFGKVEREPGTKRTLILKHPNRYIPQFMEDLSDIPLILHMGDMTKQVIIEVANVKSFTLRVKTKNSADIDDINLATITEATINAKSPVFLLEELRKQFNELGIANNWEEDFDLQVNLCANIEFVFGPPGTGKTTYLAQNVLIPLMHDNADCKVLVLTPTNKSADVLTRKIMECSKVGDYCEWLVRFGATGDEEIEQSGVFRDKTFDIRTLSRNVTVTTIARFPYDFFMPKDSRIFLNGINWDYIVIDEASMIPMANIVFPLYKKSPKKFIIAGDPFQIEPITAVDLWKNKNIYTLVGLKSFIHPMTTPHQYEVKLLTTQYRSIPNIGSVFSNFAYGGILKHYRDSHDQRPLNLGDDLGIATINVIKFPVSKYESIYRCKRLQHSSSYQIYSALFTFEYVSYLAKAIAAHNPGASFKIGVIAPYKAQADLIDKLLGSEKFPKEIDVQAGTIHGFQGDECDIIFVVFNTSPTITTSKAMFLNKLNIINVAVSRARDYLFIVMPNDETENIANLQYVRRIESLIHRTSDWKEFQSPDLEEQMFGDAKYLENNAFSTSHQSVNVYGLPEKCYEIRAEDSAIDVQIHKSARQHG